MRLGLCVALVVASGCKYPELPPLEPDANPDAPSDAPLAGFALDVARPTWVRIDGTQSVTVSVTREAGFNGAVTVMLADAPAGITASPVEAGPETSQVNLLISASSATGAAVGNYPRLRILGVSGSLQREAMVDVLIAGVAGSFDGSFGNGGIALGPNGFAFGSQLVGDKYLVSGTAMARFEADGSLDMTFGGTGTVQPDFASLGASGLIVMCAAAQADGKVVVVGSADGDAGASTRYDLFVLRLMPDGSPDPTFTGRRYMGPPEFFVQGCKRGPDDEVVIFGSTIFGGDSYVLRLLPDGSLDTAFGPNGRQIANLTGNNDIALAVDVEADGDVIVVFESTPGGGLDGNGTVVKYLRSGGRDLTFGGDGIVDLTAETSGAMFSSTEAVLADATGILVGGSIVTNSGTEVAIWKLQSSGAMAPGFGAGGVWRRTSSPPSTISAMSFDDEGDIFAASLRYSNFQPAGMLFHHVNAIGTPDNSWGADGTLATTTNVRVYAAHLSLRRIAFVGDSGGSPTDRLAVMRLWY